ncbi:MAG TPA: Xaa-Pro peptidase family protein [Thermoplasmata archaeon]|jgi:Xaa-Pro dipeptidase|nr:Xaa-Pro peptidase family protein [Thermoplasmata archaeon]
MKPRVQKIFQHLDPAPDALVFANAVDPHLDQTFFYVFDVPAGLFEGSLAIAHPDGKLDVLTASLEAETAREAAKKDPNVEIHVVGREETDAEAKRILGGAKSIGLNYRELTHEWYLRLDRALDGAKWVDASNAIRRARVTKDPNEIQLLRKAADIGSKVGREIPGLLRAGMTELELAAEMEYRMNKLGASGPSFSTIVAFGSHSAEPHYSPAETKLKAGDSIVCDFGAYYKRYASDITRSFHFGRRDDEMKRVHETVEAAQKAALEAIRPGVPAKEVHLAAQRVIDATPWKGRLTHGVGHSIGLVVHDGWAYAGTAEDPLEVGMAITVEPGIYLPGHGGVRIEDDVVVTKNGYEFLTTAPREYIEVAA